MKLIDDLVWNLKENGEWILVGKVKQGIDGPYIEWFK